MSKMRKIIPYHPYLVVYAKELRNNMTFGEIALWREIKGRNLGQRFSRQIPIDQYIVDFYCKDLQLAIEVDGSIHFKPGHPEKDKRRQTRLESFGITAVRFLDTDVKNNLPLVINELKQLIEKLEQESTPSLSSEGNRY